MRTLRLMHLMDGLSHGSIGAPADATIHSVTIDSRKAAPGVLFVACPGATAQSKDGHDFIPQALQQGVSGLVVESEAKLADLGVDLSKCPCFVVKNARRAAALLAEKLHGNPSSRLRVVGITGTNGKSTITFLLASALERMGRRAAVFGTLGAGAPKSPQSFGFTTPEAEVLSSELSRLHDEGFDDVAMEVSSHALATARVDGVAFSAVAFSNLSQDHLDFHADMQDYFEAKARLFSMCSSPEVPQVLPASTDGWATELRRRHPHATTWGLTEDADVRALHVRSGAFGLHFDLCFEKHSAELRSSLLGSINLENLLCAAAILLALGHDVAEVAAALSGADTAPGRLQRVESSHAHAPLVIVDYAHTPDALERTLRTIRMLQKGKLAVVFGCGGERDRAKRPLMAKAASSLADMIVLTNDNPRREAADSILDEIEVGIAGLQPCALSDLQAGHYAREPDRRDAIAGALAVLGPADILLIAGKGHEKTQCVGEHVYPFDDVAVAASLLEGAT